MGVRLELKDVQIESLVPAGLDSGDADQFLRGLSSHDAAMNERWRKADAGGQVLRYVGRLDRQRGTATVRLESLPRSHPFANINLTDNIVRFASARYSENPLVVQGPGAGRAVTAGARS